MIYPVILSGGSGTRLWPLSRAALPKQLLALAGERSMLQETVLRCADQPGFGAPLLVCNQEHRFLIAEQLRQLQVTPSAIVLEPVGRNTAPAATVAALRLLAQDAQAVMLLLPADHLIADVAAFQALVAQGREVVEQGFLVTFGVVPQTPETGYGYIQQGAALAGGAAHRIARFVEKPDAQTAAGYLAEGGYFWNSGIFLCSCRQWIEEMRRFRPDIVQACEQALAGERADLDFCRLDEAAFAACPADSIDYAVMERTAHAAVLPAQMGWNDIGAWSALWEVGEKDARGNVARGDVWLHQVDDSLVRAESRMVAVLGARDLVVVETADAVLVADRRQVQDVKRVVEYLQQAGRPEHLQHPRVFRPWGWYEGVDTGERFQVKRICVKPGAALSLQLHHHRAEHWVVVRGTARVVRGDDSLLVTENESVYIPLGTRHRLENPGKLPLEIIEVQSGSYLGEDDIVRLSDDYGRS